MSTRQVLVNRQFNSPMKLYSPDNVADVLNKQSHILANGNVGIDFHKMAAPGNLANSAVLRMLEESERGEKGLKRVAWPPPPENLKGELIQDLVYPKEPVFYTPISTSTNQDQPSWSPNNPSSPPAAGEPVFQRTYQTAAPIFEPPPTVVTLRRSAPVSQAPPPIFESQPAAIRVRGPRMRGDEKWPPAENKAQVEAVAENEARKALAKGPAVRPRAPKKDYSKFFAQHQLTNNYPGYRAPPGTQHYVEEGTSNF